MVRLSARGVLAAWVLAFAGFAAPALRAALPWHPVRLYNVDYVSAEEVAARYGFKVVWLEGRDRVRLESKWTKIELKADSREMIWNGLRVYLGEPVVPLRKTLGVSAGDVRATLDPLVMPASAKKPARPKIIALDAGHGGRDAGTANTRLKLQEKTFTLDVVRRLKIALEKLGYRTVLTRHSDKYIPLEARPAAANRAGADLFVSVHFNSLEGNAGVRGIETYAYTPAGQRSTASGKHSAKGERAQPGNRFDHWNILLAASIQRQLVDDLGAEDRGVKRARFLVLSTARCPAVLVEAGFLSSTVEARKIATPAYRDRMARSIANGVHRYVTLSE